MINMPAGVRGAVALVGVVAAWAAYPPAQPNRAAEILTLARDAIGGESRLRAVKSLSLKADSTRIGAGVIVTVGRDRTTAVRADDHESRGEISLDVLLPDKFLVTTRQGQSARYDGVNGDRLIVATASAPPAFFSSPAMLERATGGRKREFVRYITALLLMPPEQYHVVFSDGGEAEVENGRADVLDASGDCDFNARLFFDKTTHRLLALGFQEPPPLGGVKRPATAPAPTTGTDAPLLKTLEGPSSEYGNMHMRLADYRAVDGILLPFRIRTEAGRIDDWRVSKIAVNPPLKPKLFER